MKGLVKPPSTIPIPQSVIESKTAELVDWWMSQRLKKFQSLKSDTMSVNPLLAPIIMRLHGITDFDGLAEFLLAGHLAAGHFTGFGKLVDEKLLPRVFATRPLTPKYRNETPRVSASMFDEIDHLVARESGTVSLLSLKSSRWTIQLTMAVQLNGQFAELVQRRREKLLEFDRIVLGVVYGTAGTLSDKYDIARGVNTGAAHGVVDLTSDVDVLVGQQLFEWLNHGEADTQRWVMNGIAAGVDYFVTNTGSAADELIKYRKAFARQFEKRIDKNGNVNWQGILTDISS